MLPTAKAAVGCSLAPQLECLEDVCVASVVHPLCRLLRLETGATVRHPALHTLSIVPYATTICQGPFEII